MNDDVPTPSDARTFFALCADVPGFEQSCYLTASIIAGRLGDSPEAWRGAWLGMRTMIDLVRSHAAKAPTGMPFAERVGVSMAGLSWALTELEKQR